MSNKGEPPDEVKIPLVDPGNPFVATLYPTFPVFGVVQTEQGPLFVATIRSGPATLTVHLSREDALDIGRRWMIAAEKVPILHVAKGGIITPHRNNPARS